MQAAVADSRQERLAVVAAVGQSSSRQQQQEDRAVADRSNREQESIAVADSRQLVAVAYSIYNRRTANRTAATDYRKHVLDKSLGYNPWRGWVLHLFFTTDGPPRIITQTFVLSRVQKPYIFVAFGINPGAKQHVE